MGVGDETPSAPQVMSGLLDRIADRRPLDDALTDGRVRLDWSTYRDRAAALAGALGERGVRPGDRVAVHLPKSVDSFVAAHAVVRLGAVMVPVDWFAPPAYVGDVIGDLNRRRGLILGMDESPMGKVVDAEVPLSEMFGYATALRSATQGRATYTMEFLKYQEASRNVADEVIAKGGMQRDEE